MLAAKTCGVLTPKIKIKPAGNNIFYQFARDLSDPSFANHQGSIFQTLVELNNPQKAYQLTANNAVIRLDCMNDSNQRIDINKHSLAMLVVAALVFDFRDVHTDNVGVVISPSEKTADFAVVDLFSVPNFMARFKFSEYASLADLVQADSQLFGDIPVACLTNAELAHALDVIDANFKNACTAVQAQAACHGIEKMLPADHVSNMITRWERNLETLKLFSIDPRLVANLR